MIETLGLFLLQSADPVTTGFDPQELLLSGGVLRAIVIVVLGVPITYGISRGAGRIVGQRYGAQRGLIAGKLVFYPLVLVVLVSVLSELGFSLAPLLGAAGILGVALGFASQTSVSNVISGLFLLGEQPFQVGDVIRVGNAEGFVLSVDTLSVKLRTFDNHFVRIPNETILKSEVVNLTRFPIRRIDLVVGVAYKEDPDRVRAVLLDVAHSLPLALVEPVAQVQFVGYGPSSIDLKLAVWTTRENFLGLKGDLAAAVKRRLDEEGIEIPFPHRTLYAGANTEPLPIRVVSEQSEGEPSEPGAASP